MKIVLSGLLVILMVGSAAGQIIHIDDLDYFVGCFAVKDTADYKSVQLDKFVQWKSLVPDQDYQRDYGSMDFSISRLCIFNHNALRFQNSKIRGGIYFDKYSEMRYYLFTGSSWRPEYIYVLTSWETVTPDSIKFIGGQIGKLADFYDSPSVEFATVFPDTSILIIAKFKGYLYGLYRFHLCSLNGNFEVFYETEKFRTHLYPGENGQIISYDFNELDEPLYQVIEIQKFVTGTTPYLDGEESERFYTPKIDSVETRILDLWDMAQEFRESR